MNAFQKAFFAVAGAVAAVVASAQFAAADVLTDAVDDAGTQIGGYATPIAAVIVTVGLLWIGVKLIPRALNMISARFGGH